MPNVTTSNSLSKRKWLIRQPPPLSKMWEIALPTPLRIDAPGHGAVKLLLARVMDLLRDDVRYNGRFEALRINDAHLVFDSAQRTPAQLDRSTPSCRPITDRRNISRYRPIEHMQRHSPILISTARAHIVTLITCVSLSPSSIIISIGTGQAEWSLWLGRR